MKDYQGPVFNNQRGAKSTWKNRTPRFARTNQSMSFSTDKQILNDDKDRSPLLKKRLEFEQAVSSRNNTMEESTGKSEYRVPFKPYSIDDSKWDLSPEEEQITRYHRTAKHHSTQSYEPALEKRVAMEEVATNKNKSPVGSSQYSTSVDPEEKVDKNLRKIAKRMTKSQDSYLLFQ